MKQELINRLNPFFLKHPALKGKPTTITQITDAEKKRCMYLSLEN